MHPRLESVSRFLDRYYFWLGLAALGLGAAWAGPGKLAPYVPYQVAFSMFVGALNVRWHEFLATFHQLRNYIWFGGYLYVLMPATSWAMAKTAFEAHPEWATGLIFAAVLPCGITGAIWTLILRGRLTLNLSFVTLTTLASGFLTPWLLRLWAGAFVDIDVWGLARNLVIIVVLPVIVGLIIHERKPEAIRPWQAPLALEVKFAILVIVVIFTSAAIPDLKGVSIMEGAFLIIASLLHLLAGHLGAYIAARRFGHNYEDSVALAFSSGVRNTVAGAAIATTQMGPKAALPVLLVLILQQPLASLCLPYLRREGQRAGAQGLGPAPQPAPPAAGGPSNRR